MNKINLFLAIFLVILVSSNASAGLLETIWVNSPADLQIISVGDIVDQELATLKTVFDEVSLKNADIIAATNGSFFGYNSLRGPTLSKKVGSTCLYVKDGKQYFPYEDLPFCKDRYVFYVRKNNEIGFLSHGEFINRFSDLSGIKYALEGVDVIFKGKKLEAAFGDPEAAYEIKHPKGKKRNGICMKKDGKIALFIAQEPMRIQDLGSKLKKLGCYYSINLDGGGTSSMYIKNGGSYIKDFGDDKEKNDICKTIFSNEDYKRNNHQGVGCIMNAILVSAPVR